MTEPLGIASRYTRLSAALQRLSKHHGTDIQSWRSYVLDFAQMYADEIGALSGRRLRREDAELLQQQLNYLYAKLSNIEYGFETKEFDAIPPLLRMQLRFGFEKLAADVDGFEVIWWWWP